MSSESEKRAKKPVPASLRPMKMTPHRRAVAKRAAVKRSSKPPR